MGKDVRFLSESESALCDGNGRGEPNGRLCASWGTFVLLVAERRFSISIRANIIMIVPRICLTISYDMVPK